MRHIPIEGLGLAVGCGIFLLKDWAWSMDAAVVFIYIRETLLFVMAAHRQPANFSIAHGDELTTTCTYNTPRPKDGEENTIFGLASKDEMCIDFVFYYPRVEDLQYCGAWRMYMQEECNKHNLKHPCLRCCARGSLVGGLPVHVGQFCMRCIAIKYRRHAPLDVTTPSTRSPGRGG
eukprot:2796058-Pyramimonas_sp.AAC.1